MSPRKLELPTVTRIQYGNASIPEPSLNPLWTPQRKLLWRVALTAHDTGHDLQVHRGRDLAVHGDYSISTPDSVAGISRSSGIEWLRGFDAGVRAERRRQGLNRD